jgi:predicted transcriptional regulator
MKKAVNLRLEERIIALLNNLSEEFHTTKTEIVEKAIERFSKESRQKKSNLMDFAGKLGSKEADNMLEAIRSDKDRKEFSLDL